MQASQFLTADASIGRGLSEDEAARRLRAAGYNELQKGRTRSLTRIAIEVCSEPMFELLLVASAIYFVLGNRVEGLILLASAITTVAIATVQENRTERVLEALRALTSPRALVVRDGLIKRIPGREVVGGDTVILSEGDRVPADAILHSCNDLEVDESLLTGESVPVRKRAGSCTESRDSTAIAFAGTMIVRGHAVGEVVAIGAASEVGKIGKALGDIVPEPSLLHRQVRRLVRVLAAIGIGLSVLVALLYVLMRGGWLQGLLAGVTLAMALLPEEFPFVLTIFLAMGAWRISRANVLTRRSATIETLGAATVLCTDKTGTLTVNRMSVAELFVDGESLAIDRSDAPLPAKFLPLVEYGVLASEIHPFDPMERAFHEFGQKALGKSPHEGGELVHEYELSREMLAVTHVWKQSSQDRFVIASKGAPETIAKLCNLPNDGSRLIFQSVAEMAARGMRVIAVARASSAGPPWPDSPMGFRFAFLGLVGLADPIRAGVSKAIAECHSAGIRVMMITGDYPATAKAIAMQAGLDAEVVLSGNQIEQMSERELGGHLATASVFARMLPEQKLSLVNALKANGEIVAMTGDGVNDAPCLKAAHIGIAMGERGTDVAREASAIVLLDDNFASIVGAIRLGRRISDNIRKAMAFLLAVHVPIAGLALLPLILGWPMVFNPLHIAFLELIVDPVASIVFEAESEEGEVMRRPPRNVHAALFSPRMIAWSAFQGAWVMAVLTAVFAEAIARGLPAAETRTLVFVSLVMCNSMLIFVNRSDRASIITAMVRPNLALWIVLAATIALLTIILSIASVRVLFAFAPMNESDYARLIAAAIATTGILELAKIVSGAKATSV